MSMKSYDLIVIGGGGGLKLVSPAARLGKKVAVIEKESLGGTCLNRGCIPSKMLIYPSELVEMLKRMGAFEFSSLSQPKVDFSKLTQRIQETVQKDSLSIAEAYKKNPNIDFYQGRACFIGPKEVSVGNESLRGEKIVIATGSRPHIPSIPGLKETPFMTSREALERGDLPRRLIVLGGGYIAVELGCAYAALGCDVTFLVRSKLMRKEDRHIQQEFSRVFKKNHKVLEGVTPLQVTFKNELFSVKVSSEEGVEEWVEGDAFLIATGVVPNTDDLALAETNVTLDKKGYIQVDSLFQTAEEDVYAIGDVIGRYLFRHTVNKEGEFLFDYLFGDKKISSFDYGPVPHAVFSWPQIGAVGKTEEELKAEGIPYVVGVNSYEKSAMGMARLSKEGLVKVLFHKETKQLLGAHVIGDEASNMVHLFMAFMVMKGTLEDILSMIFIHPALPEVARNAVRKAKEKFLEGGAG